MFLTAIIGFIASLGHSAVLFLIGKILCHPTELRKFLGLNTIDENSIDFQNITIWIEYIGQILKIIAILNAIVTLITPLIMVWH